MTLTKLWKFIQGNVFTVKSTPDLFNPYRDNVDGLDLKNGSSIRRKNLKNYLESFDTPPDTLLVGEATGFGGCRFSGVPFSSERQIESGLLPFRGKTSCRNGTPKTEPTATIFWEIMKPYHPNFFVWNSVPFHPHKTGDPLSNRFPSRKEIDTHSGILLGIVDLLEPARVIAVGRKAEIALSRLKVLFKHVPHPSRGKKEKFKAGISEIF